MVQWRKSACHHDNGNREPWVRISSPVRHSLDVTPFYGDHVSFFPRCFQPSCYWRNALYKVGIEMFLYNKTMIMVRL